MNKQYKQRKRWLQISGFVLGSVLSLALVLGTGSFYKTWAKTPATYPRNQALYVTARDGTKIALDLWLPVNLSPNAKIPALMRTTPYRRALDLVDKSKQTDPNATEPDPYYYGYTDYFNKAGYAVVLVDARGVGASFGNFSPDPSTTKNNIQDYNAVVNWITAQPWSNHKVGAYGTSADGTTAEFLAVTGNPAVKAVVPRAAGLDPYLQEYIPGGLLAYYAQAGDEDKLFKILGSDSLGGSINYCGLPAQSAQPVCRELIQKLGNKGVKPVDEDPDKRLLTAAVQQHANNFDIDAAFRQTTYRDDRFGSLGLSVEDFSLYSFKNDIEHSHVAVYSWASWFDAGTADGVTSQFMTLRNPQKAIIGPWTHGAYKEANPYLPADTPVSPSIQEQLQDITNFFDTYLKDKHGSPRLKRELKYYTLGENQWKTTNVWPPKGVANLPWYFSADGNLTAIAPTEKTGMDTYTVNFEATNGPNSRWTQSADNITYPDRAEEDKKLLTYTSPILNNDVEITGNPVVTLYTSSTATDGAFFVYLEDVDEAGHVIYLTEGELRPLHRKISDEQPPYKIFGPYHSFKQKDGMPLVPGQVSELSFEMLPISVLIKKGHQIRVAIAGHDQDSFLHYPAEGTPVISVQHNTAYPSRIDLPVIPRSPSVSQNSAPVGVIAIGALGTVFVFGQRLKELRV